MGLADHLDFLVVAHVGLFEVGAEGPVDQSDRREILHAREARILDLPQEAVHEPHGIGPAHAGQHGRLAGHRQDLVGHLQHDGVGVAKGHQPGQRAMPGHAESPGVVDHDQVDPAGLLALGADARARPAADDRLAAGDLFTETLQDALT